MSITVNASRGRVCKEVFDESLSALENKDKTEIKLAGSKRLRSAATWANKVHNQWRGSV